MLKSVLVAACCLFVVGVLASSRSWLAVGPLTSSDDLEITVYLRHSSQALAKLHDLVEAVSDPFSDQYGNYVTIDDLTALLNMDSSAVQAVDSFWRSVGAQSVDWTANRDACLVRIDAESLSRALPGEPTFHVFKHQVSGRLIHRTTDMWHMPASISDVVELITGVSDFHLMPREQRAASVSMSALPSQLQPYIQSVSSGPGDYQITVVPFCQNGHPSSNPFSICSDQQGSLPVSTITLTLSFDRNIYPSQTIVLTPSNDNCELAGGVVACSYTGDLPSTYIRFNVSAVTTWGTKNSPVATYPLFVAPGPYIDMSTLKKTYSVPQGIRVTNASATQGCPEFENQWISLDDLAAFLQMEGLPAATPIIVGLNNESAPGGESTLDIQLLMGVAPGAPSYFMSFTGNVHNAGKYILDWLFYVANTTDAPLTTSVSYGDTEQGYYDNYNKSFAYILRCEVEFQKMAARGMSVFAGSGDAGASNVGEGGNDLSPTDPTCTPLRPFYPSESQYVTSLSSTFLSTNYLPICKDISPPLPVVCDELGELSVCLGNGVFWTAGGGFSNLTFNTMPSWQKAAVPAYLNNADVAFPPEQYWNRAGRGYPDVATLGYQMMIVWGGQIVPLGGTSASGPVMAALATLFNNERLNKGLPPVGLMNPILYWMASTHPACFNDIVVGNNKDGDLQPLGAPYPSFCPWGYEVVPGWDAATGLGSPNFAEMMTLINDLPALRRRK